MARRTARRRPQAASAAAGWCGDRPCYSTNIHVIKITDMARPAHLTLTRRERQIMDILYRLGRATAAEVIAELPPPRTAAGRANSSTVRTQLRVLEEKGHVRHEEVGLRYIYLPAVPR